MMTAPSKSILQLAIERLTADIALKQAALDRLDASLESFAPAKETLLRMKQTLASLVK
jgi:hypothetical protein